MLERPCIHVIDERAAAEAQALEGEQYPLNNKRKSPKSEGGIAGIQMSSLSLHLEIREAPDFPEATRHPAPADVQLPQGHNLPHRPHPVV